jgi:hypothetical protein
VEKALALLPETPRYTEIRQEARASLEVRIALALSHVGEWQLMRAHIVAALTRYPWMSRYGVTRVAIAEMGRRLAMASDTPTGTTQEFCRQLKLASRRGLSQRLQIRRVLASVWLAVAASLLSERRFSLARHAAVCGVLQNPGVLLLKTRRALVFDTVLRSSRRRG